MRPTTLNVVEKATHTQALRENVSTRAVFRPRKSELNFLQHKSKR